MSDAGTDETTTPFLESEPPRWAARGLAYLLLTLFVTALLAAFLVHLPETVSAPFVLVPKQGTDPVRAARAGVVTQVAAGEGGSVQAGADLFTLRSQPVGDRFAEYRMLQAERKGAQERLANERKKYDNQRLADAEAMRNLRSRAEALGRIITLKESQHDSARELAARYKEGLDKETISYVEYSRAQGDADKLAVELEESRADREEAHAALEELQHATAARETEFKELERSVREEMDTADIRLAALEKDLGMTSSSGSGSEMRVKAPCAGTVIRLRVNRTGAVVQEGDVLCELACAGSDLQAELAIPQSGMAQLRTGQPVKLLYDAFPYQRYGVRHGMLRWISPAALAEGAEPVFRAIADTQDTSIRVRDGVRPLRAGMGGTAQIVVGRRSLVSYAFEPLRQLQENLAETPKGS
ncbi:MAG TPA: HlyD family efflux transporter periplasmic adaptor subunit [Gemmatimonadota bacterium]